MRLAELLAYITLGIVMFPIITIVLIALYGALYEFIKEVLK